MLFPIPEFLFLGFGVSVKIALKVVRLPTATIPDNVFIYLGTMVFGCLVAQDFIRLTHDGLKFDTSSSERPASAKISKRILWFLRFAIDGCVFSVVYGRERIGILPFISILFSLCLIKCYPSALPPRGRIPSFLHQVRFGLPVPFLFPQNEPRGLR